MSPKTKKNHLGKVGKPRMAVRRAMPSSSSAPATPDPQQVANMAMELAQLAQQMMAAQGLLNKQGQNPQLPEEWIDDTVDEPGGLPRPAARAAISERLW